MTKAQKNKRKLNNTVEGSDYGIVSDGVTDQTALINSTTAALGASGFRGVLVIRENTKFNPVSVFAACPTGVGLDITDTVNWGQPPGYKNKFKILYYGDLVNDDTQKIIASGHHPAMMLLNMGTAPSVAAANRYGSILQGVGRDIDGDPMVGWMYQFAKAPSADKWRVSWRLQTPYNVAIANPTYWTSGQVVSAGAYRISDGGKVYQTTAGGTCGATAPTGTGTGINDGGVLWNYIQAVLNIDSTRMDLDENGNFGTYGPASVTVTSSQTSGTRTHSFSINGTTNEIVWRDDIRGSDIFRIGDTYGLRFSTAWSPNRVSMAGAAPNAPITGFGKVSNGGATNMTSMPRPAGRTNMRVELRFDDANTTLVHSLASNDQFRLRGAVNASPPANSFMTFELDTTLTGVWQEVHRSF